MLNWVDQLCVKRQNKHSHIKTSSTAGICVAKHYNTYICVYICIYNVLIYVCILYTYIICMWIDIYIYIYSFRYSRILCMKHLGFLPKTANNQSLVHLSFLYQTCNTGELLSHWNSRHFSGSREAKSLIAAWSIPWCGSSSIHGSGNGKALNSAEGNDALQAGWGIGISFNMFKTV